MEWGLEFVELSLQGGDPLALSFQQRVQSRTFGTVGTQGWNRIAHDTSGYW